MEKSNLLSAETLRSQRPLPQRDSRIAESTRLLLYNLANAHAHVHARSQLQEEGRSVTSNLNSYRAYLSRSCRGEY